MTNEIKEIIDYLKDKDDYIEELGIAYKRIFINNGDLKTLLDYITNLQESEAYYYGQYKDCKSRNEKAVEYINKYEYQRYCPSPYEKEKYIMREEKEGQDLLNILRGDE